MTTTSSSKTKRCRLIDVAKAAGVSRVTAAKVLLGTGGDHVRVSSETHDRVSRIGLKMGYRPNMAARQLKGMRTNTIGVIIDSFAGEFAFQHLADVEQEASRLGWRMIIGQSHNDPDGTIMHCDDFAHRGVDGVICLSHRYPDSADRIAQSFIQKHEHVVFAGKPHVESDKMSYVDVDVAHGTHLAVEHFITSGRRRIGLIKAGPEYNVAQAIRSEYINMMESHGIEIDPTWIQMVSISHDKDVMKDAYCKAASELVEEGKVDAILTSNDRCAAIVIKQLKRLGLSVPGDIAIIGEDNLPLGELVDPELTTIDHRKQEISTSIVQILVDMIEGKELPPERRQIVLKPNLIIRESA